MRKKLLALLMLGAKMNENHDEMGRFAEGSSGGRGTEPTLGHADRLRKDIQHDIGNTSSRGSTRSGGRDNVQAGLRGVAKKNAAEYSHAAEEQSKIADSKFGTRESHVAAAAAHRKAADRLHAVGDHTMAKHHENVAITHDAVITTGTWATQRKRE